MYNPFDPFGILDLLYFPPQNKVAPGNEVPYDPVKGLLLLPFILGELSKFDKEKVTKSNSPVGPPQTFYSWK